MSEKDIALTKEELRQRTRLEEITEKIDRDVDSAIVEGFSDKRVLQKLGFQGRIFLSAERTIEGLAEDVERSSERVAVLTDFDSHGKEENRKIRQQLQDKVDVISSARKEFGAEFTSNGRMALEDAAPLYQSKKQKFVEAALDRLMPKDRS